VWPGHRIEAIGAETVAMRGGRRTWRHLLQIGHGILPTHYWIDGGHVVLRTSLSIAAILEEVA
jgi:hypothetical protein